MATLCPIPAERPISSPIAIVVDSSGLVVGEVPQVDMELEEHLVDELGEVGALY